MKKNLVQRIIEATGVKEPGLRVTLSNIKKRHDLKSIDQAACLYIKKKKLDINVSSVIDNITRQVVQSIHTPHSASPPATIPARSVNPRLPVVPKIRWMPVTYYSLSNRLADFYGYLFIFENALRLKIDEVMRARDANWWETKVKANLYHDVYEYAEEEKARQARLPMVGRSSALSPLEYITIGHLEQIIIKYQNEFVPSVFPNLHFFTGHMVIVKRVRNAVAHMSPSISAKDIRNAKNEIDILLQHFSTK